MLILSKWKKKSAGIGIVEESQRNIAGDIIVVGEFVKVRRSKEDSCLIDIISVSKSKRIIRNVQKKCVRMEKIFKTLKEPQSINQSLKCKRAETKA